MKAKYKPIAMKCNQEEFDSIKDMIPLPIDICGNFIDQPYLTNNYAMGIDALEFAKYPNNVSAMIYLNEVLSELSFSMSAGNFKVMQERVFKIMKDNELIPC